MRLLRLVALILISCSPESSKPPELPRPARAKPAGKLLTVDPYVSFKKDGRWVLLQGVPIGIRTARDASVTIAFVDSGVLTDHPQLQSLNILVKDFTGTGTTDRMGHGTLMMLLYLAGDLPDPSLEIQMRLIHAKVVDASVPLDVDRVIDAINWSSDQGARIISLSLGFEGDVSEFFQLCKTIAAHKTILFSIAAGNSGPDTPVYPASCPGDNIIRVGDGSEHSGKSDVNVPIRVYTPRQ